MGRGGVGGSGRGGVKWTAGMIGGVVGQGGRCNDVFSCADL